MKWKKTLENAIDRLTLTESIMNERCMRCKGLCIAVILRDAYQNCLWRRHCGDGSRDLHANIIKSAR